MSCGLAAVVAVVCLGGESRCHIANKNLINLYPPGTDPEHVFLI